MTSDRHRRVNELFLACATMTVEERAAFLDSACAEDVDLRRDVLEMLSVDDDDSDFLVAPPDVPSMATRRVPDRIGEYRLVGVLGEGGMGTVYEAEQDRPHRRVALKVMRPGLSNERLLQRFDVEVEALGRLQHPGIAQIFEARTFDHGHGPQPFFAMELVRGEDLTEHCRKHGLGTRQRLDLVRQVCEAVHHANIHGVVHRDLKPANVLVDERGRPKVLDFGVARATDLDVQTMTSATDVDASRRPRPRLGRPRASSESYSAPITRSCPPSRLSTAGASRSSAGSTRPRNDCSRASTRTVASSARTTGTSSSRSSDSCRCIGMHRNRTKRRGFRPSSTRCSNAYGRRDRPKRRRVG